MNRSLKTILACCMLGASLVANAAPGSLEAVQKQPVNISAIAMFMVFVLFFPAGVWGTLMKRLERVA